MASRTRADFLHGAFESGLVFTTLRSKKNIDRAECAQCDNCRSYYEDIRWSPTLNKYVCIRCYTSLRWEK
jgi:hypothetical protein